VSDNPYAPPKAAILEVADETLSLRPLPGWSIEQGLPGYFRLAEGLFQYDGVAVLRFLEGRDKSSRMRHDP
jgi:hypothetical protein